MIIFVNRDVAAVIFLNPVGQVIVGNLSGFSVKKAGLCVSNPDSGFSPFIVCDGVQQNKPVSPDVRIGDPDVQRFG